MKIKKESFIRGLSLTFTSAILIAGCLVSTIDCNAKVSALTLEAEGQSKSASIENCLTGKALKYAAEQLDLNVSKADYEGYLEALVKAGILLPDDLSKVDEKIKKGELALLASRIMDYKGEAENKELSDIIQSKKRISDLSKIKEPYKSCIVKVFGAGVMTRSSNGKCSQSRKFKANEMVSAGAVKSVIQKALAKKDRSIMSPDGQLTRTNNLPKNADKYEYILASFPNSFYEQRFSYQYDIYFYKPENLRHYVAPSDMVKYQEKYKSGFDIMSNMDRWERIVGENLKYRFNFNYKTVNNDWITGLRNTYFIYNLDYDKNKTNNIKNYINKAKKNQTIIETSDIVVEPSTLYCDGSSYMFRCYVRFRIISAKKLYDYNSGKQNEILYSEMGTNLKNLKQNQWIERYFDIGVSTSSYGDDGSRFAVASDYLIDRIKPDLSKYKDKKVWTLY